MSQNSIEGLPRFTGYNVLVLYAAVRRIDDDFEGSAAATANLDVDAGGRPINTRLSRRAQDIPDKAGLALAMCRSAGERTSVLATRFTPLPRLAGVTIPRQR